MPPQKARRVPPPAERRPGKPLLALWRPRILLRYRRLHFFQRPYDMSKQGMRCTAPRPSFESSTLEGFYRGRGAGWLVRCACRSTMLSSDAASQPASRPGSLYCGAFLSSRQADGKGFS